MSDSLRPHGLQYTRLPCPSPTPRVYSNSSTLSRWCHPTISSSVVPFSSRLQSFSTVPGICISLLLPLTALAAHLACLRSLRELLPNVHQKIMFSEKKNALPKPRWGKGTVGESNTVLFSHTHTLHPSFPHWIALASLSKLFSACLCELCVLVHWSTHVSLYQDRTVYYCTVVV